MKLGKKIVVMVLAAATAVSMTACGARGGSGSTSSAAAESGTGTSAAASSSGTVTWRIGHNNSEDHYWTVYMRKFADLVAEKSNGTIKVEVYPNSQLGDDTAMGEMIRNGNLDEMITGACVPGNWYQPMSMMEMAGLFDSSEHVERAIYGKPGEIMKKGCADAGIMLWDNWMRTTWEFMSTKPINSLADFKGLKTRVTSNDVWVAHMEGTYGIDATPMAFSEVFTSLQQGVVNAVLNPISSMYTMRFHELCNYLILTESNYDFASVLVSPQSWSKLTADQQKIMQECEDTIREEVNEYIKTEDETYIAKMKDENPKLQVITLDSEEIKKAGRAIAPKICAMNGGQELYDAIRACGDDAQGSSTESSSETESASK